MTEPHAIITDSERTVPVSRDLAYEIAAVSAAILDAREEKTRIAKEKNLEIKALEKRQRQLIEEIRSSGDTQLVMKFGSSINTERALAQSAPTGEDERDDEGLEERVDDLEAAIAEQDEEDEQGPTQ